MKCVFSVLICLILGFFSGFGRFLSNSNPVFAREKLSYAMILSGCVLFAEPEMRNAITRLPATYFVVILSEEGEFYRASYLDIEGYVAANSVEKVDFTPKNKFAEWSLTLTNDGGEVNIRSSPDHKSGSIVTRLPDGEILTVYGEINGSVQNALIGEKWYAVQLNGGTGYVYSMYAEVAPLAENVIEPEPDLPDLAPEPTPVADEKGGYFLIAAMCLPAVLVMYLLFSPKPDSPRKEN